MKGLRFAGIGVVAVLGLWGALQLVPATGRRIVPTAQADNEAGIHKIRHIVIIMQENRSFDSFFGTFPGADGIPMKNGVPTVCVPDPYVGHCVRPYHTSQDRNAGGPHDHDNAIKDIDGGKMDGFIEQADDGRKLACAAYVQAPTCSLAPADAESVMGYHDAREIPNYWA